MPPFFARARTWLLAALMGLAMVQIALGVGAAMLVTAIIGKVQLGVAAPWHWLVMLGGATLLVAASEVGRRTCTETLGLSYVRTVRLTLLERMLRRPYRGPRARSRGSQLLPFVGDLTALKIWWADGVARGSSAMLIALGLCGWMIAEHSGLGVAVSAAALACLAVMAIFVRPYARATRQQRNLRGTMTALISDRIAAAHTIVGMGNLRREMNEMDRRIVRTNRASIRRAGWSGAIRGVAATFPLIGALLLLRAAGAGHIGIEEMVGLLTVVGLLAASLADIGRALELAIPARISRARIGSRIAEIDPITAERALRAGKTKIIVELAGMQINGRQRPFDAMASAGEVVLVDGQPGVGKSTFLAALCGLQRPSAGHIYIRGREASLLSQRRRRTVMGVAAEWTPILHHKLLDNLCYRTRNGEGREDLAGLMTMLELSHLLKSNGEPSEIRIRDKGGNLADAVIAAIRIVRAAIGRPALLVLDHADRHLSEAQIAGLARLISEWRGLVVMISANPRIRALATRRWNVTARGIEDEPMPAAGALHHLPQLDQVRSA